MCGIVGAVAKRDVLPILMEGLRRLEYRGYDSAGVALIDDTAAIVRVRVPGKIADLSNAVRANPIHGLTGIAHTRWATHGAPSEKNAHPHIAFNAVAVVHNGIIENFESLKEVQLQRGYLFTSDTDTEVIAHQVHYYLAQGKDLFAAVQATTRDIEGAFALGVVSRQEPGRLVAARRGSPLVIGIGLGEHFIASDAAALLPVTQRFAFLDEGDLADLRTDGFSVFDASGAPVDRPVKTSALTADAIDRGPYRHFMLKEIHEQPRAIADTLEGRTAGGHVLEAAFGPRAARVFEETKAVQIVACGTSYHAAIVARDWLESLAEIPCKVEVASEFRYRRTVIAADTLLVTISQSGETADTLAALRKAKSEGYMASLTVCNVAESSLVRESDLCLMTRAGPEIGVASTKAFTTQLVALMLLVLALGRRKGLSAETEQEVVSQLLSLPGFVEQTLASDGKVASLAERLVDKRHALFLGRGVHYPVAMEGALKLKEISYIHAEAYPAGELKHGPLALVDADMPVVTIAPCDALLEKLKSNLQEVRARGGELYVFADTDAGMDPTPQIHVIQTPSVPDWISPIVYTVPLQLLAYHVAVQKGTDVDQPRNLAKSVTVE